MTAAAPRHAAGSVIVGAGLAAGAVAPVLFITTVVVGGWLRPGFDQRRTFVSELGEVGSPAAAFVNAAFALIGVLVACFALALRARAADDPRSSLAVVLGGRVAGLLGVVAAGFVLM